MMESYKAFAQFYDCLTENVDYKARSEYISGFFSRYGSGDGKKLLDLACGTGSFSKEMTELGYEVTGIDLSYDMLTLADNKCDSKVKLFKGDMTDFSVDDKFDYCICMLDSINHITSLDDVIKCFNCVHNALKAGGIFIFDVNTIYKHTDILADNAFVFDNDDFFLSWDNEYEGENIIRILLDIFVFNGKNYDRLSEEFYEKAYSIEEYKAALEGFDILGIFDEMTENEPDECSERIYFVCKRK